MPLIFIAVVSHPLHKVVIINPYCHEGRGWHRWLSIKDEVFHKLSGPINEVVIEKGVKLAEVFRSLPDLSSKTCIISAGGDGTINFLINHLLTLDKQQLENMAVGAVGLGSSNDFLKPFGSKIKNIPVRIDWDSGTILHDVGLTCYNNSNSTNSAQKKYFIVNASFGVTAEANWNFNHPDLVLKFLKKYHTGAAIGYTAVTTILKHRNTPGTISYENKKLETSVSNINILKNPYVSGSFHYNQNITRGDGHLGFNACLNMSVWELVSVLGKLQQGNFPASSKTVTELIKNFQMAAPKPFLFEYDGETEMADFVSVSIVPRALKVLKS